MARRQQCVHLEPLGYARKTRLQPQIDLPLRPDKEQHLLGNNLHPCLHVTPLKSEWLQFTLPY